MFRNVREIGVTAVLAAACVAAPAADYHLGLAAFDRGDAATAEREFSALARQGDPAAQHSLAMLYLKSDPPSYERAVPWLEKAARSGVPESQYVLGMLAIYGVGTGKDVRRGMRLLESASAQGNENARALLEQLEKARLRAAASARRKAERARELRAELERAEARERALRERLARSRQREKTLAAERASLEKARASDARAKQALRSEHVRLERELESMRAQLAAAERSRAELETAKRALADEQAAGPPDSESLLSPAGAVVSGTVVEVLADGVLLTDVSRRAKGRSEPFPDGIVIFVNLESTDGLSKGQEVAYAAEPATPYRYQFESGATGRIRAFRALAH